VRPRSTAQGVVTVGAGETAISTMYPPCIGDCVRANAAPRSVPSPAVSPMRCGLVRPRSGLSIRGQRTGFQKIAQVLADSLLREIAPIGEEEPASLSSFRIAARDAAKLSPGMRQAHHLDTVRQAVVEALGHSGQGPRRSSSRRKAMLLTSAASRCTAFLQASPQEATIPRHAAGPAAICNV